MEGERTGKVQNIEKQKVIKLNMYNKLKNMNVQLTINKNIVFQLFSNPIIIKHPDQEFQH